MIEKFTKDEIESAWAEPLAGNVQSIYGKVNEIIDAINAIQKEREAEWFEIQAWIGILEAVRKSVNKHGKLIDTLVEENNIHEEQIDELQMKVEPEKCKPVENTTNSKMENVDPYAEQRKWVGKLCWFWDFQRVNAIIGVLTDFEIDEPHFRKDGLAWYEHCEPVKPDDDIIYKGE